MDTEALYDLWNVVDEESCQSVLDVTFTWTEVKDGLIKEHKETISDITEAHELVEKLFYAQPGTVGNVRFKANFQIAGGMDLSPTITDNEREDYEYISADIPDKEIAKRVVSYAVSSGGLNISIVQRRFSIGYACAARIIDRLKEIGVIKRKTKRCGVWQYDVVAPKDELVELIEKNF